MAVNLLDKDEPLISLRGITKSFGDVLANDTIDLEIFQSEVLALLGENGAGKSTLVKILYGFYQADEGAIEHCGKQVRILSPQDARSLQIGMVFQVFNLIPAFTVAENIALFTPGLGGVLDLKQVKTRIEELSQQYNLVVDPEALVADLSMGDQQKVEILKLLVSNARILILDEPTRVLVPHEIEALFRILDNLRADGYAILLITHKMDEVLQISDRIAVLRQGKLAGLLPVGEATKQNLIELMFSRAISEFQTPEDTVPESDRRLLLELRGVSSDTEGTQLRLQSIELKVHRGEIVGITGVSGNGQKELADLVLGRLKPASGTILLEGEDVTDLPISAIRRKGVAFIPESPLSLAVAPYLSVLENAAVPQLWAYGRSGGLAIDWEAVESDYTRSLALLGFELPLHAPCRSLSGGNLQRMVIARELAHHPRLIIASYLTNGLDVRSAIAVRNALVQARALGAGVLLFSDELEELFSLSDLLIVLQGGRIRGSFKPEETDYEQIGYLMTGSEGLHAG